MKNLLSSKNVVVWFDGFVDTIVHRVDKRDGEKFSRIQTSGTEYTLSPSKVQTKK